MRLVIYISVLAIVAGFCGNVLAARQDVRYDLTGWRSLEMTSGKIVASGGAPAIKTSDGRLRLSADKIVLGVASGKGAQAITTAEAVGRVKLFFREGPQQTIDAVASKAVIHPAQDRAELTGNVRVVRREPAKFSQPVVLTGDTVTVYLKDGRIVARSNPGRGSLSATPKSE